jgi:hypothetical protein
VHQIPQNKMVCHDMVLGSCIITYQHAFLYFLNILSFKHSTDSVLLPGTYGEGDINLQLHSISIIEVFMKKQMLTNEGSGMQDH